MKTWQLIIIFGLSSVSLFGFSASQLTEIKIENDILYFSTVENQSASPSCVLAENNGEWAVSMNAEPGKSSYLALMTAAASGQNVEVVSANDCADAAGFERPNSIAVVSG